jgi:tetratricopeptide (TPR) repeat protein
MKIQLDGWLKPSNVRAIHQSQVQARLPGTCNWIWQNSTFKQWMQPSLSAASDRLLCISGTHGCGKSVLASSILEGLKQRTLFFSFSGTDTGRQGFDSLVRSFIWQLLQDNSNDEIHEMMRGLMLRGQPLVSELWESFIAAAALISTSVYCIIDGVDECCDSMQTLLEHILKLLSAQTKFRALLLGRPPLLRTTESERSQTIEIDSSLIKQDIDAYIDAEIGRHDILKLPRLRDTVAEVLKEKSEGMFLWVKLMVDDLRKSDTLAQVEDRLCDLPRGIEKAYRLHFNRLIEQLDPYQLALAKNVFDLAIASLRPLEVEEFRHAHALRSGYSVPSDENLLMEPERRILAVCGGLIKITNRIIRPIHFSMKEYLLRPEDEWLRNDESRIMVFRVDFQDSHRSLGSICAKYLTICDYGSPLSVTDHFVQLQLRHPMLRYASLYGVSHLTRSGSPCPATVQNIRHFLGSEKCASWIEYVGILAIEETSAITPLGEVERFMAWLDQGGYKEEFLIADFLRCINQELEKRTRQFGENDWRTEQCQLFLGLLQEGTSDSDVEEDRVSESESPTQQIISNGPANLSRILTALNSNSGLPGHRGVNIFLRLQYHLRHAKVLTDPLKMLFRIILQKAPIIPIYALLVIAEWYCRIEKLEEALQVYRAALAKVGGQEIPIAFNISASIGRILVLQKRYEEAEVIYGQTLKLGQQLLGIENEDTLQSAHELGHVLTEQEKYEEAEAIHRSTLESRQKVLGKEDEDTLRSASQLGYVLGKQEKYEEAEAIHRSTLESRRKVLGKEDEYTLHSAYQLGYVLTEQEKYEEAEAIHKSTLESRQKVLGKEDEDTLRSASQLGYVLGKQEKYEEAEAIHKSTLESRQQVLGTENEETLTSAHSFSVALINQKKFEEAEPLIRQNLEIRQKVLGKEHEDTLQSAHNLSVMLRSQGKFKEAETLLEQTLKLRQEVLGTENEDTLHSAYELGYVLGEQEKYEEAETIYKSTLKSRQKVLGTENEDTLRSAHDLGYVLCKQEKYEEAEAIYKPILKLRQKVLGKEHKDTLQSAHNLSVMLRSQGKFKEAEALLRSTLKSRQEVLGKENENC